MALHSVHWDRKWRVRADQANPIGWPLFDATGKRVGRIADLLTDDRTRRAVYAVADLDGYPPVLIDVERLTCDERRQTATVALSLASLAMLSPATWWRRPQTARLAAMQPTAAGRTDRIVIPVYGEELVVEKRPVVVEEIVISKRQERQHRMVTETLRRERVDVQHVPAVPGEAGPTTDQDAEHRAA